MSTNFIESIKKIVPDQAKLGLVPYEIQIIDDTGSIFLFEPIKYIIIYEGDDNEYYKKSYWHVFRYSIKYKKNDEEINTEISYYVSNAGTNKFRANMLYPFMCFNQDSISCPIVSKYPFRGTKGLLLKYLICKNINCKKIVKYIDTKFNTNYRGPYSRLLEECNDSIGITSVLSRLENIIDYIIAISCEALIKPTRIKTDDVKSAIKNDPDPPKQGDIDGRFYRADLKGNGEYGHDMSIMGQSNYPLEYINDKFAKELVQIFNTQIINMMKSTTPKFTISPKHLDFTVMTRSMYNNTYKILETETKINPQEYTNIANFAQISSKLYTVFNEIKKTQSKDEESNINTIESILIDEAYNTCNSDNKKQLLIDNINLWLNDKDKNKYKNKYIKYKNKYLSLKKQFDKDCKSINK